MRAHQADDCEVGKQPRISEKGTSRRAIALLSRAFHPVNRRPPAFLGPVSPGLRRLCQIPKPLNSESPGIALEEILTAVTIPAKTPASFSKFILVNQIAAHWFQRTLALPRRLP